MTSPIRQYAIITGNYWAFTLTDGALRMLVVLHFHQLGYSPMALAALFLFYEIFGVITNLLGGYLGARIGLKRTMNIGLGLQLVALAMLTLPSELLTMVWVMAAQALSGIAKDLNKMSAKSALKTLIPANQERKLFKWVAVLTGSKNALKGVGFFIGGALLAALGFRLAIVAMLVFLAIVACVSVLWLVQDLGKAKNKPKFRQLFAKSRAINLLAAARLLLFGARDIWFVVALPVFLSSQLGWDFWQVGGFLAAWVIGYGLVQSAAPWVLASHPAGRSAQWLAFILALATAAIAWALATNLPLVWVITLGLALFGILFALNSALHSYLIVSYAQEDGVSMDVGFYYMANALGRLLGTLLSGWVYQTAGLSACLWLSSLLILVAGAISIGLPRKNC
jgi:MFS family permease